MEGQNFEQKPIEAVETNNTKIEKESASEKVVAEMFGPLFEKPIDNLSVERINADPAFRNLAEAF